MPRKDEITWTKSAIATGLYSYFTQYGKFPTAHEIDAYAGLPSSRQIQRSFGGLVALRRELGMSSFNSGEARSATATAINKRSVELEAEVAHLLIRRFGEICVHIQKPYTFDSKKKLDFYVFSPDGNFGVDVFYAKDRYSFFGSLRSKIKRYADFPQSLYFVYKTPAATRFSPPLASNRLIMTMSVFEEQISKLHPYPTLSGIQSGLMPTDKIIADQELAW